MIFHPSKLGLTLAKKYYSKFSSAGVEIMSEDWDNCIIIDACRFDLFKEENTINGDLKSVISSGSSTFEFFENNFRNSTQYDTVYVTANPVPRVERWCDLDLDEIFHTVIDVWKNNWDKKANTVRPEPVKKAIINAHKEYPDKRIIGHFIQPHQPFIGETGQQITERGMRAYDYATGQEGSTEKNIWERLEDGEVSKENVWTAYRENLDIVLPHLKQVIDVLSGKTVVTSDHGNLIGEYIWPFPFRGYGHPPNVHTKKLVTVPWLEINSGQRRTINPDPPQANESSARTREPTDRLRALGYY